MRLAHRLTGGRDGVPVLFLHGGGPGCASYTDFRTAAAAIAPERPHLFVDLAQYGASEAPRHSEPAFDYHVRQLTATLDLLEIPHVDVVAQSLGGSVAMLMAATSPERVGRLVATGSQPVPDDRSDTSLAVQARSRYYGGEGPTWLKMRELMAQLEWCDGSRIPEVTVRERYGSSITPWAMAVADGTGRGTPQSLDAQIPAVGAPTLLVWGAQDPFASPAYAATITGRMPRGELVVLDETAHHPQAERPDDYARVVNEFLDRKDHR
ncbi:pimeloyl-ACP methyl ester carboxylesterase [Nocardioides massiliensis]|uniref:Pimeloyl-ACP methyl ester carboxylesterase n=1 Tax=Nocardioides massiliensis TaxID=1325935 RepID=A0ABT9NNP2_9ACTN|nr:alpha/beta hydrolase [Nocardioides massiliensis]MDP9821819.1 pimeloyl-ACP methyl ester carboxylesterase [Nocardioides massiliensis]